MRKQLYESVSIPSSELATAAFHHFGVNPMGWTGIDKLTEYALDGQYVQRILDMYAYLLSSDSLLLGINPCQYVKFNFKFQLAAKSLPYDKQLILDCYLFLANYYVKTYNYQFDLIEQELPLKPFISASTKSAKLRISMLSALLRSYSETLYCDEHTIAGETYSPIEQGEYTYIVRKFTLLCAKELRNEIVDCPVHDLTVYLRYKGLIERPVTNIVGNLLTTENILPHIDAYHVETVDTDGQASFVSENGIDELIDYFSHIIPVLVKNYRQASLEDRLWMKIMCEYYATKPYCDLVGIEWRPQNYILDLTQITDPHRPLVRTNQELSSLHEKKEILRRLIELNDPRIHW